MKILKLRFKNLNSLYGEWCIDFTHAEYASNGIFALTGPTGSGKSTVLDAICLALYGATPRLGKITKSGNEIMSRQTGECYAEVVFESQAGRYLCHWEQRKARKSPDGKLQDQEHQIAEADTGKLIETKRSLVLGVVEEKTGMDFERFTRSILLAQGGFDTFLKADVEQKSRILEQITGTEIYSKISLGVHERQREEKEKLNVLQAQTSGIVILQPEQEKQISESLSEAQKQEVELACRSSELGDSVAWLTLLDELQKEIIGLAEEATKHEDDIEVFKLDRVKLEWALKAAEHEGGYATLISVRKQQAEDQERLDISLASLPELELSASRQSVFLTAAQQSTLNAKQALKDAAPIFQRVRSIDQTLCDQEKAIATITERGIIEADKLSVSKLSRVKEQERRAEFEKHQSVANKYLKDNAKDEWLVSGLAGIEEQISSITGKQNEIYEREVEIGNAEAALIQSISKLSDCGKLCQTRKQEYKAAADTVRQGSADLNQLLNGRLLREYRTEKETLLREMVYLKKIEGLEDYRAKLEDGKPCLLCGSKEHPFAEGNIPVSDDIEQKVEKLAQLVDSAEALEASIKSMAEYEATALKRLNDSEKLEVIAANDKKTAEEILKQLQGSTQKLLSNVDDLKKTVLENLQPLGVTSVSEAKMTTLFESLKSRLKAWQGHVATNSSVEKNISDIDGELKGINAAIDAQEAVLLELREGLKALGLEHGDLLDQRKSLYGNTDPDSEEQRLSSVVDKAEQEEKKAGDVHVYLQQKLTTEKTHSESLKSNISHRGFQIKDLEAEFLSVLGLNGFISEEAFIEARLTQEVRGSLSTKAKRLDDARTDINARKKDREARLDDEIAKKRTDESLDDLQLQLKECESLLQASRDAISGFKHKLNDNVLAKEKIKEKQFIIEAQKHECQRWEKLHSLIGSADGKKYRNFAQGLTFELMVSHANRQLEKMTDRYLLIRDEEKPLELNVLDNYQAGEVRSTRNLSGGESFIVSLTLALGLSKMSSRKVRVDSLFLDEGFGTLDEDALDTALEVLSGLHQEGKLIGVISHVSALKERISSQIQVVPSHGGRSDISGPGCSKVA